MDYRTDEIASWSDAELLERHRHSDHNEYLGVLYERYIPLVYGVCLKYLRDADDASDGVLDIFEQLLSKIKRYEVKEFRTWIYSVTKNHCISVLQKKKREVSTDFSNKLMENPEITHLLIEKDDEGELRRLKECLGRLPENQRASIEMFFFQDKSYADIVAETRFSLGNVKSYIQNGKRNLKNCLGKRTNETD